MPEMTLANGDLSDLSFNETKVVTGSPYSQIAGGRLAALFEIRDEIHLRPKRPLMQLHAM